MPRCLRTHPEHHQLAPPTPKRHHRPPTANPAETPKHIFLRQPALEKYSVPYSNHVLYTSFLFRKKKKSEKPHWPSRSQRREARFLGGTLGCAWRRHLPRPTRKLWQLSHARRCAGVALAKPGSGPEFRDLCCSQSAYGITSYDRGSNNQYILTVLEQIWPGQPSQSNPQELTTNRRVASNRVDTIHQTQVILVEQRPIRGSRSPNRK